MTDTAVHAPTSLHDEEGHGHHTATGLSNEKLAMWVFLGSDCLLFGGLISTYLLLRHRSVSGLGPDQVFDIPFTSVSSFVLLMSSLTMVLAVSAIGRGDVRNAKLWLVVTALLGATFVGGQAYEFTSFYREGLGFTTSLFSSSFYTLTGFHGVHVTVGIIMLLFSIGLELSFRRLWSMRRLVFAVGAAELVVSAALIAVGLYVAGATVAAAGALGLALALSCVSLRPYPI